MSLGKTWSTNKNEAAASWILGIHLFFDSKGLVNGRKSSIMGLARHEALSSTIVAIITP